MKEMLKLVFVTLKQKTMLDSRGNGADTSVNLYRKLSTHNEPSTEPPRKPNVVTRMLNLNVNLIYDMIAVQTIKRTISKHGHIAQQSD